MLTVGRYGTRDLDRAGSFYDAIAGLLGAGRAFERPGLIAYKGADGAMFLIGEPLAGDASVGNGTQMGFAAPSRATVNAVYAKALELGGADPDDPNGFYGAYFRDLDGNKITVFRMGPDA
jgi:catechol 2,3-dioxygenase-like lactoylglutathione lyase family enzyme